MQKIAINIFEPISATLSVICAWIQFSSVMKILLRISASAQQSGSKYYPGIYTGDWENTCQSVQSTPSRSWNPRFSRSGGGDRVKGGKKSKECAEEAIRKPLFLIQLDNKINKAEVQKEIQSQKRDLDIGHDECSALYDRMTNQPLSFR